MALIKEYFELTKKYQDEYGDKTIVLMQVGAFMEVYGIYDKDADLIKSSKLVEFGEICELNVVEKNVCVGKNSVMMAGFKDFQIEKYLKKLNDVNYTAVVYTQDENVKNTTRSLAGVFSPGTYFQTDTKVLSNSITCIWVDYIDNKFLFKGKYVVVGIANIDIYTGKTSIFQFKEHYLDSPTTYDELERFISVYNPSEVILISNLPKESELDNIISYAGISCSLIHKIHTNPPFCNAITLEKVQGLSQDFKKPNVANEISTPNLANEISTPNLVNEISTPNLVNEISTPNLAPPFLKVEKMEKMERIKNCEKQPYQKEILSKFYKFDSFDIFIHNFYENNIATQAFCYLLDFVYQHNPQLVNKIAEPIFENCSMRLTLANHSLKQLNIINDGSVKPSALSSVSDFLNKCSTQMGKRKFLYNILNPTSDQTILQSEYDITEYFLNNYDKLTLHLKNKLCRINDLSKIERQIILKKISPKSFYMLNNSIVLIGEIFESVKGDDPIIKYLQNHLKESILEIGNICDELSLFINENIDVNIAKDIDQFQQMEVNFIRHGVDTELDTKTEILKVSELKLEAIREYFNNLIENREKKTAKSGDFVKIHETEKNNYSLILTGRRCKILQEALPINDTPIKLYFKSNNVTNEFLFNVSKTRFSFEKQTASNNCVVDEQINAICKNITSIKILLKDLITLIYNRFIEKFSNFQNKLEQLITFITLMDVIYTKTTFAKLYNYCKPEIEHSATKAFVEAKCLRHCLLEQLQTNELYIPNDISLGDDKTNGILLYGTNAVGKTIFIKSLGIAIIMAQAGLYVPCSSFKFKPYKHIFTRIIGNDNLFKGLSTFEVEMLELRTILKLSDENSLILGDELCSGTETISAISIFVTGIQKLHEYKSSFIFATHLHEIVDYEEITSLSSLSLKHMTVKYDNEKGIMVYDRKIKEGSGNNIYGLEVCKSLNFQPDFLEAANEIRLKYNPESRSILSLKQSHYNSKKILGICEKCNKQMGTEIHHMQYQSEANENGIIVTDDSVFHKNDLSNLMSLCNQCHDELHKKKEIHKRVKTSKGTIIKKL
jgi:DNA mismatch repair protein MutS